MSLVMTGAAERPQIVFVMRPATGQRKYVMYLRCRCEPSGLKAVFAKRMCLNIPGANLRPDSVVLLDHVRVTAVLIILSVFRRTMFIAVPTGGQFRAAGK